MTNQELCEKAKKIRINTLKMITEAGSGHPGGSLSAADILVALYYGKMKLSSDPNDDSRDRFVLSKGHANPALYAVLADKGYFPEEELKSLRKFGSILQGHPDSNKCPGIDCSTGSLGQGLSVAVGMALGFKRAGKPNKVYVLTGDGELQEGLCWEAFMSASHFALDNLTVIIDRNMLQIDGCTEDVMSIGDLESKMKAFGFSTETVDGHDFSSILPALDRECPGKPRCIIAKTVKGKGVSFMENQAGWHGTAPKKDQLAAALSELGGI